MRAVIAGFYELPGRRYPDVSLADLHMQAAEGALEDAGLELADVDGYLCAGDAPGVGPFSMIEYMGLSPRYVNSTETGGSAYINHVIHAISAIESGLCEVALITCAGRTRSAPQQTPYHPAPAQPELPFEAGLGLLTVMPYALVAARHAYEHGTTDEMRAAVKIAAANHAQHNPNAFLQKNVTVDDFMTSTPLCDPLRVMDACVVCDGGGAIVIAREDRLSLGARQKPLIRVRGRGFAMRHQNGGDIDITSSAARDSAKSAFKEARVPPDDIRYASIYDSFTITLMLALEDMGFCKRGQSGAMVLGGALEAHKGAVAVNTDGGGLCSNHIAGRGGMPRLIEALRQLSGRAAPALQLPDLELAVVHGTGGFLGLRHACATLVMERYQ